MIDPGNDEQCLLAFVSRHIDNVVLRERTLVVLRALPSEVRSNLIEDEGFLMVVHDPRRPDSMRVWLAVPGPQRASRCVGLKLSLARRPPDFAHYVIAHELAHAFLGNRGRWEGDDPEVAADALAGQWGFPRPFPGAPILA